MNQFNTSAFFSFSGARLRERILLNTLYQVKVLLLCFIPISILLNVFLTSKTFGHKNTKGNVAHYSDKSGGDRTNTKPNGSSETTQVNGLTKNAFTCSVRNATPNLFLTAPISPAVLGFFPFPNQKTGFWLNLQL